MKRVDGRGRVVIQKNPNPKKPTYQIRDREYNFLKYWRIVRYYITRKYDITLQDLELLLFFYDEPIFSREEFNKYCSVLKWSNGRMNEFLEKGIIKKWRDGTGRVSNMYELTAKSKLICNHTYKKLLQEESISENPQHNPVMKGASYTDRMYRSMIKKMNSKEKEGN